jgi:phage internal scaffolding protein
MADNNLLPHPFVRTPYNYNVDQASQDTGLECPEDSLAQQHAKDETDLNKILESMVKTGTMPQFDNKGMYGDFTSSTDYHTHMNRLIDAQNAFYELNADVRKRFNNDPAELIDFLNNADNLHEAQKLGLINEKSPQAKPAPSESEGSTITLT